MWSVINILTLSYSAAVSIKDPHSSTQEWSWSCIVNTTNYSCTWKTGLTSDSSVSCCYGDVCPYTLSPACPDLSKVRVQVEGPKCTLRLSGTRDIATEKWECDTINSDIGLPHQKETIKKHVQVVAVVILLILSMFILSLLVAVYIIFNHRPHRPDTLQFKYFGTRCEVSWDIPPQSDEFQPLKIESYLPIKHYVIQKREGEGAWKKVGRRTNGQPLKYIVEGLTVGTEVEFNIIAVNIVGRKSEPSEPSPAYTVIGK